MDDSFALDRQIELDRGCVQPENVREFARTHPDAGAAMNAWLGLAAASVAAAIRDCLS
jgi:hypothetical protein